MTWNDFRENRPPDERALYWWRTPPRDYGGIEAQPEFAAELTSHYDGCRDKDIWLPSGYTTWTGYRFEIPDGLEWAPVESDDVKKNDELWPSVKLSGCPFCGRIPRIKSTEASLSGGRYNGLICPGKFHKHNWFSLDHRCSVISSIASTTELAAKIAAWNNRERAA